MSPADAHLFRRQATTGAAGDDGDAASTSAAAGTPTSAAAPETTSQAAETSAAPETTSQGELPAAFLSRSFFFLFSFWAFRCLCVVSMCLRACVFAVLLGVSVRFWSWHMRSGWVSRKSAFSLARARSLVSANPNKRSVGTQNDLDHQSSITSHDSDLAIAIWTSPPFRQYTLFLSLGISRSNRSIRRAETREKSESYSPFRTR
ncbi:hypothetical protein HD553DRAFT_122054 [Filobasidium floriforme]|uniref:uncharacterized protein n=1 Tax=Filobasidium floriforme TaxID=5210 RepID=UPI001E8EE15F|nr:uncharacterized protein HD553DRAFT_122054 [Filobasidium floriforme]KAH8080181.1 hypothetical protein HD553DRAFT_122054 [Filobasidium floriforme]